MFDEINKELAALQEGYTHPDSLEKKIREVKRLLEETRYELRDLEKSLEKENLDVENMEKNTLTTLFYQCLGIREKRIEKEKEEALAAKLKYDACKIREDNLIKDMSELTKKHYEMSKIQKQIDGLKQEKRRLLEDSNTKESQEIQHLRNEIEGLNREIKEIKEAISPGKAAINVLGDALRLLDSAGSWGTFDLLGGGLVADMMKHNKIDEAKQCIMHGQMYLQKFQVELQDVNMSFDKSIQIPKGAVLADFFFDGLIADWYMQSKINQSKDNVDKIYRQVEEVVNVLSNQLKGKEQSLREKQLKIEYLIEQV